MLDGADGWAARRQGLASAFGARFDMEIDAFATLVLAITAVKAHAVPGWVLAIGAMRYFYLAAALAFPLLRRPLPPRTIADRRRKTIAVIQSIGLTLAFAPQRSRCSPIRSPPISLFCCPPDRIGEVE
jgi:phosphatidylglycerophosphate synthase